MCKDAGLGRQKVFRDVEELRESVRSQNVHPDDLWFKNLLFGILTCALEDCRVMQSALLEMASAPLAWRRRNLLELAVITEYVLRSKENAEAFKAEVVIDAKEFYECISRSTASLHEQYVQTLGDVIQPLPDGSLKDGLQRELQRQQSQGPPTRGPDSEADQCIQFLKTLGLEKERPKQLRNMAEELGAAIKAKYGPMNKVCSKIMHRTAMSIAASTVDNSLDETLPWLEISGFMDLMSVSSMIENHFAQHGIKPPA